MDLIGLVEAAKSAGVHAKKARRLCIAGVVPSVRIGGRIGVRPGAFEPFREDRRKKAAK